MGETMVKLRFVIVVLLLWCSLIQAAELAPNPKFSAYDVDGKPLVGGKLYTYLSGTTTPKKTYTDSTEATENTNPIILNSLGQADVWLDMEDGPYRFVLVDSDDVTVWTQDNINSIRNKTTLSAWEGDLESAILDIGSSNTTLYIDGTPNPLLGDLTIPSNIMLEWDKGCILDLGGNTITINGPITAGIYQLWSNGTVSGSPVVDFILPYWWGENTIPGTTEMGPQVQAALDLANSSTVCKAVMLFSGRHKISQGIELYPKIKFSGLGGANTTGTVLEFPSSGGLDAFYSDPTTYLSNFSMSGFQIIDTNNSPGNPGPEDCFVLPTITNNSSFKDLVIRNFSGNAFTVNKQTGTPTDSTGIGNAVFEQVFVISCGGHAFEVDGYVNAIWLMCDINSTAGSPFLFKDGVSNQASINIISTWFEGTQTWSFDSAIIMDNTNNQSINLIGCTFVNGWSGSEIVKIQNSTGAKVQAVGCSGFGFTNFINDTVSSETVAISNPINYFYNEEIRNLAVKGTGPTLDIYDTDGTANQNRFRLGISGTNLVIQGRLTNGSAHNTLLTLNHSSALATFGGGVQMSDLLVTGTAPAFSIYDTDGSTVNQRRFRYNVNGNTLTLSAMNDNGSLNRNLVLYQVNTGVARFQGPIGVGNTAANTNTPSGATARQWPLYDEDGNLIGYVPVYGSAW
jgi:hypothetical protein